MKHIILTRIVEGEELVDMMVDGSKIVCAVDNVERNRRLNTTVIVDTNRDILEFVVNECAIDIMKKIDECDQMNRR